MILAPFLLLALPRFSGGYFTWLSIVLIGGALFLASVHDGIGGIFGRCISESISESRDWVKKLVCKLPVVSAFCTAGAIGAQAAKEDSRPYIECRVREARKKNPRVCQAIGSCGVTDWTPGSPWLQCVRQQTPYQDETAFLRCYSEEMGSRFSRLPGEIATGVARFTCEAVGGLYGLLPDEWENPETVKKFARCAAGPGIVACGG
jgi:hypothetical protein